MSEFMQILYLPKNELIYCPSYSLRWLLLVYWVGSVVGIVERDVPNVIYSERKVRVLYSQSDKILGLGVIYPK